MRAQAVACVIIRAVSLKLYLQVASGFDTDFLMHILKKTHSKTNKQKHPYRRIMIALTAGLISSMQYLTARQIPPLYRISFE